MRTVVLLRHAKSSWALPGVDDFERVLNERGDNDAVRMGDWLGAQEVMPDILLCSPATRTRMTAQHIQNTFGTERPIIFLDEFYLASSDILRKNLSTLENSAQTAMVIAHNPGLHDLALRLLTADERARAGSMRVAFPTAACAIIELPIDDWADIAWNKGVLSSFMVPKSLSSTTVG